MASSKKALYDPHNGPSLQEVTTQLEQIWEGIVSADDGQKGWGKAMMRDSSKLLAVSLSPVSTIYEHIVTEEQRNGMGNMQGGCTATIFDVVTSMTLLIVGILKPGSWPGSGVSRYLNVTYLRPAPVGEMVTIESEIVDLGRRLCTLRSVMKRKSDGALIATCEHGKVNIDPKL